MGERYFLEGGALFDFLWLLGEGVNFDTQKSKTKLFENFTKHCCFFILFAAYQLRESSSTIHTNF